MSTDDTLDTGLAEHIAEFTQDNFFVKSLRIQQRELQPLIDASMLTLSEACLLRTILTNG